MIKKFCYVILILNVFLSVISPVNVDAATITLGEYEAKLAKYKQEYANNKNAINKTESEISSANKEIENLKKEVIALSDEIDELKNEIDDYNQKIKDKLAQSKQIVEYMQLSSGENAYLEYVFNAESTTELIYRAAVVKELVDYNNRAIAEMEQLISDNENRQVEIDKRQDQIAKKEEQLGSKIVSLGEQKETLLEGGVSVAQEIENYQKLVDSYKKLGCKSSDRIGVDCAVSGDAGIFRRPTKTGYITQEAYYGTSYTHRGLDIGSYNKTKEKIYPIGNGTVIAKYYDYYGALVVAIEHYSAVKKQWYTSFYAHLDSFAPNLYVGKSVTSDQYIGYMGNTGYSFGVHLHFELVPCRLYVDKNCSKWNSYVNYTTNLLKNGYKGPRSLINFPSGLYNSWSSR